MIEEESKLPLAPPDDRYGEGLLYDFSKFVTTLSLIALGGVLSLTEASQADGAKPVKIAIVLALIAASGVIAVSIASSLAESRSTGREPSRWLPHYLKAAMALLGIGVGAFIQTWWKMLG